MYDFIYMNNAATSWPKAPGVAEAVAKALSGRPGAANRGGIERFDVFGEVRRKMAALLGLAAHDHIALGGNATWSLNLALFGYPLKEGDAVVTSKSEHNSVLRPLYELERRIKIKAVFLDTDKAGRIPTDKWEEAIKQYKPKLAVFTHASNITGAVNDAQSLSKAAKAEGADVLVDASQTCGWEPICTDAWNIDMLAFTGHKYLLGPQGTGGLYVRPGLTLSPHLIGGTGSHSDLRTMPDDMPSRLEAGTGNEPSFCGLLAALEWAEQNPLDRAKQDDLLAGLRQRLTQAGADVIIPSGACTPTVSFNIPGQSPAEVGYILEESYDILCRTGLHCAPILFECLGRNEGTVRFSMSRFTTMEEIDAVVDAVKDIANAV
ncbi:MAG: aminotransferase class V-fold PLP-dependent enzyme [Oscillospiraceae bacterium]|nr:aminotransferase class V-fold PLP-dependent enzyme [Oscillospiraceae bacterium]